VAHAPRGALHGFRNAHADIVAQALCLYTPPGYEQYFRDVHAANAHYVLNWDINGAMYGRVALGLSPDATI